jgi:hypothetical protein
MRSFARRLGVSLLSSLLIYVPGVPVANAPVKTQTLRPAQHARQHANPPVNCRPVRASRLPNRMRSGVRGT